MNKKEHSFRIGLLQYFIAFQSQIRYIIYGTYFYNNITHSGLKSRRDGIIIVNLMGNGTKPRRGDIINHGRGA
jgi:hypothetical protein